MGRAALQLDRKLSKYLTGGGRLHYDPDRCSGYLHVTVPSLRIAIEQMKVSPLRSILHTLRSAPLPLPGRILFCRLRVCTLQIQRLCPRQASGEDRSTHALRMDCINS